MQQNTLWIERFLEMISAQRQASQNTLAAYKRDLVDFFASKTCLASDVSRQDVMVFKQVFKNQIYKFL